MLGRRAELLPLVGKANPGRRPRGKCVWCVLVVALPLCARAVAGREDGHGCSQSVRARARRHYHRLSIFASLRDEEDTVEGERTSPRGGLSSIPTFSSLGLTQVLSPSAL